MSSLKFCRYCSKNLPLDMFHVCRVFPDGRAYKCKECIRSYQKTRHRAMGDILRKKALAYYYANRKDRIKKVCAYKKKKCAEDPIYKKVARARSSILTILTRKNRGTKPWALIGCSAQDFAKHIEGQFKNGMSWGNKGTYGWHIDHIRPLASFDLSTKENQMSAFNYKNTQPLWKEENMSKGAKLSGYIFRENAKD